MKSVFDSIVDEYAAKTDVERLNAVHEVMQQFALAGLARGGFFKKAAFYGGTALHLFYDLPRFSEDLDFSLLGEDVTFRFEDYFDAVKAAFLRRIDQIDFAAARDDVRPFVKEASVLDIWSKEYFSALTDKMRFA